SIPAARHICERENGELGRLGIMPEMIAKRAFDAAFMARNAPFKNDFRSGRDHEIQRLCPNHRNTLPAQETRESYFVNILGQGKNGCHHEDWIGTKDNRSVEVSPHSFGFPVMAAAAFHALPVHSCFCRAEYLQPVETEVATLGSRML